jgi:hypothetical protein
MSCSAPRPCSAVGAAPPINTTGDCAIWAFLTAVSVLVTPGPAVTAATPWPAGEARSGVGREDRGGLVARVHDANAGAAGRDQNRRDVPAHQGIEEFDSLRLQDRRNQFAAVHGNLQSVVLSAILASDAFLDRILP